MLRDFRTSCEHCLSLDFIDWAETLPVRSTFCTFYKKNLFKDCFNFYNSRNFRFKVA